ncbi:MAG: hypothetical protein NTW52_08155 [Planctomycetota bacterium]|nr:hypothetical protein [Planctomycetota bacterium]
MSDQTKPVLSSDVIAGIRSVSSYVCVLLLQRIEAAFDSCIDGQNHIDTAARKEELEQIAQTMVKQLELELASCFQRGVMSRMFCDGFATSSETLSHQEKGAQ